ncbi:hypothetical protein HNP55_000984 [Paucibacter oligotrophus]|uniref:Uncharacterized protein n=1 Tax=Roseateles oligotrophus TaxID=1769250 RepID=A0A840L8K0_9BURK|nr:hypothetical protein [Roseateles oligotrophus]MBB4842469.1 hypothetical protein [Roseateles oligotrophus]
MSEFPLPERQHALLGERVFNFAQAAQRHFKTNDLVVLLDFRAETPELEALPRQGLAEAEELSLEVKLKLARPASVLNPVLGAPEQVFWFLVIYEDEDSDCSTISAAVQGAAFADKLSPGV